MALFTRFSNYFQVGSSGGTNVGTNCSTTTEEHSACKGHAFACIDVSGELDIISVLLFGVVLFSVALETIIHKLEHKLGKSILAKVMLATIYKEMMILGIISFLLFMVDYTTSKATPHDISESMEFVHFSVFISMCFYLMILGYLSFRIGFKTRNWDRYEVSNQENAKKAYMELDDTPKCFGCLESRKTAKIRMEYYYHQIRTNFINSNRLDEKEFKFSDYLRRCLVGVMVDVMEVNWKIWTAFLGVISIGLLLARVLRSVITHGSRATEAEKEQKEADINLNFFFFTFGFGYAFSIFAFIVKTKAVHICRLVALQGLANVPYNYFDRKSQEEKSGKITDPLLNESKAQYSSKIYLPLPIAQGGIEKRPQHTPHSSSDYDSGFYRDLVPLRNLTHNTNDSHGAAAHSGLDHEAPDHPSPFSLGENEYGQQNYKTGTWWKDMLPCVYHKDQYLDNFWFRSPTFMLRAFQLSCFFQSVYMALFVLVFVHMKQYPYLRVIFYLAPPLHFLFFYAPSAIPHFVLVSSVGPLANRKVLRDMAKKRPIFIGQSHRKN